MQATPVSDEDFGTSIKSGIDALGSGNPMTIQTSGQLPGTITVQGGQCQSPTPYLLLIVPVLYEWKETSVKIPLEKEIWNRNINKFQ